MTDNRFPTIPMTEARWKLLIATFSCIAVLLTIYCLSQGITIIFMHFYYIPIVLLAYHYRRKGFLGILLLALAYLALVSVYDWGDWTILAGAVVRAFVFLAIGALLIYLSENLVRTREASAKACRSRQVSSRMQMSGSWCSTTIPESLNGIPQRRR